MRKKASSQDCLFHTDSVCFMASKHLISLCSSYTTFIFFSVIWSTVRVSSFLHKKRENSRLQPSGLPNWTASHFSFMPLYVDQGSGTKLFFVARQHQGYLFCLVECKVNRRNCKALAQLWCRWAAWTTDRGREGATTASCGEKEKLEAKGRWSKGSGELGDKEQTEAWSCKGNKRKREWDRVGVGRTESESRDGMDWWM